MPKNIFVLGLDQANLEELQQIPGAEDYRFHPLLSFEEVVEGQELPLEEFLDKAEQQLRSFDGTVDAVIGYWDFPVSSMVPILCHRFGLPAATLDSVVKCEHKYWSRLEQSKAIDEVPRFGLVQLDDEEPPEGVPYPMWIKPVKAFSSELAFKVNDLAEFRDALASIREGIDRVGKPFQYLLDRLDLPEEIATAGGQACLAEQSVSGQQLTVEGWTTGEEIHVYGVIDSHNYEGTSSFLRYQYPSTLPLDVQDDLAECARRVIARLGLSCVGFNIEFFWDPDQGTVNLLEVNPRHSQSHAKLLHYVDGVPNHQCMVELGLGRRPDMPHRKGEHNVAGKWFVRRFSDAVVRHAPTDEEIAELERRNPGCAVEILASEGQRLSEMGEQDSYSYAIATIHIGAEDEEQLKAKFDRCVEELPFEFAETGEKEGADA
jgi:hypothetical protein